MKIKTTSMYFGNCLLGHRDSCPVNFLLSGQCLFRICSEVIFVLVLMLISLGLKKLTVPTQISEDQYAFVHKIHDISVNIAT